MKLSLSPRYRGELYVLLTIRLAWETAYMAYMQGRKAVLREQLQTILRELGGYDNLSREELLAERADAVAALRSVCADHGDNKWSDDLHLSDIIGKHLADHLDG